MRASLKTILIECLISCKWKVVKIFGLLRGVDCMSIFEWYMTMLEVLNKHHTHMCYNEIEFCIQSIDTILDSNDKHNWENLHIDMLNFFANFPLKY